MILTSCVAAMQRGAPSEPVGPPAYLHYDATELGLSDGATISQWDDESGNGRHAVQAASGNQPFYDADGMGPGRPAVRFVSPRFFDLPNVFGALTAADVFLVVKSMGDPGFVGGAGLEYLGTSADSYYAQGSFVLSSIGSTIRRDVTPSTSLSAPHVFHVRTGPGLWTARLDATQILTAASNTVAWSTTPRLGRNRPNTAFDGWVGEMLVFSSHLSDTDRDALVASLRAKWQSPPATGLFLHYDASAITGLADGAAVAQWDEEIHGYHALQPTGGSQPTYDADAFGMGLPGVEFTSGKSLRLPTALNDVTEANIFAVLRRATDTGGGQGSLWKLGGSTSGLAHYPYTDGNIYEFAGSRVRYTVGNPATSMADPHLYHVHAAPGSWTARFNTTQMFTVASNTVTWYGEPQIGMPDWAGTFAEVRIYQGALTTGERTAIEAELKTKWSLAGY